MAANKETEMSHSLLISHPPGCKEERNYAFEVMFGQFLGLSHECREIPGDVVRVQLANAPEAGSLLWPDIFFQKYCNKQFTSALLPSKPLSLWNVARDLAEAQITKSIIPIIYGKPLESGKWFEHKGNTIRLGLDITGSVFFMLIRFEEIVVPDRDEHNRFPARASLAYQEGFLERPIVDEYVEILWTCMQRLWPRLKRKERNYQVFLTHDVDHPLGAINKTWPQVMRNIAGDILRRKNLNLAYRRFIAKCSKMEDLDPYNTFEFIMDMSERYGLKSIFYFKAGVSNSRFDVYYDLSSPWIKSLISRIHERGHEIGLHTSYEAYRDFRTIRSEFERLLTVLHSLKITQEKWGVRQHYLRFEVPTTWQACEDVGLDYDATVGFADHVGFRCGTCHEYPLFNLKTRRILHLRELPLIIMDMTLLYYMSLQPEQVIEKIERLSNICRLYGGTLSLLWHNTELTQSWQTRLYMEILELIR